MKDISPQWGPIFSFEEEIVIPTEFGETPGATVGGFMNTPQELRQGNIAIQGAQERILIGVASAPLTGIGIFIGNAGDGTYDFRAGNPSGNYIHWDQSAGTLTIAGSITATSGTIGGFDIGSDYIRDAANSFGLASTVTGGDDVRFWAGAAYASRASAPARITEAGAATFSNVTITGGSVTGVPISSIPNNSSTDIALLTASHNIVFSVTDLNTIAWASGTIILSNGRTFSISSGNTGNMAALTYVYLDPAVSTTALQTTTTYSTAMGANKLLIGTAQNQAVTASFIPFQAGQPLISGPQIGALSVTAAAIADATITNAKINDLAVSKLTAGTISSKSIVLAVSAGTGDVELRSGIATGDFDNTGAANGFIIGVDDSDSDLPKFYFGGPNGYVKFNGTTLTILGVSNAKKNYTAGEAISAADAVAVGLYTSGGGISYDTYTTGSGNANGQSSWTFTNAITIGNNSNRVLVFVTTNGASNGTWQAINASATVTFNGTTMTALGGANATSDSGNKASVAAWILAAPSTGAHDVVYGGSYGGNGLNNVGYAWYCFSLYNCKQTSIPHDSDVGAAQRGNAGAGSNLGLSVTSTVDGCLTVIGGGDQTRFHDTGSYGGDSGIMIPKGNYDLSTVVGNGGVATGVLVCLEPATAPTAAVVKASAKDRNVTDYWATTNYKSKAFLGFAEAAISSGSTGAIIIAGEATGLSSLLLGEQYYLSDTYGAVSTSVGTNTRKVGIGTSTSTLLITNIW